MSTNDTIKQDVYQWQFKTRCQAMTIQNKMSTNDNIKQDVEQWQYKTRCLPLTI